MQLLQVSDAVRPLYGSLGVKGLRYSKQSVAQLTQEMYTTLTVNSIITTQFTAVINAGTAKIKTKSLVNQGFFLRILLFRRTHTGQEHWYYT
jgi:hypothetical protein